MSSYESTSTRVEGYLAGYDRLIEGQQTYRHACYRWYAGELGGMNMLMAINGPLKLNVQVLRDGEPAIGPGKALVLDAIDRAGSISAAGRDIGMSYRRIWLLVDRLNADWIELVVETRVGGGTKSGARLTPFGRSLLDTYREIEARMVAAAQGEQLDKLVAALRPA